MPEPTNLQTPRTGSPGVSLDEVLTPRRISDSGGTRFELEIPEGWQQGRGAFGGLVVGAMARACAMAAEEAGDGAGAGRSLRSLTAELMAPALVGRARIDVELLRRGSGVTTLAARLSQDDGLKAHAVAVLGSGRSESLSWLMLPPPQPPPRSAVPPFFTLDPGDPRLHFMPSFARNFVFRNTGPMPFAGGAEAVTSGFIAPRLPAHKRDEAFLIAMADSWWPACFSALRSPRPVATLTFMIEILGDCGPEGGSDDAPLYFCGRAPAAREGFTSEQRQLWTADGRLLAINHQVMIVIK